MATNPFPAVSTSLCGLTGLTEKTLDKRYFQF